MDPLALIALIAILAAIACFLVETFRTSVGMLPLGLTLLSVFFLLVIAIPVIST